MFSIKLEKKKSGLKTGRQRNPSITAVRIRLVQVSADIEELSKECMSSKIKTKFTHYNYKIKNCGIMFNNLEGRSKITISLDLDILQEKLLTARGFIIINPIILFGSAISSIITSTDTTYRFLFFRILKLKKP